jgi:hypothetical protein
MGEFKFRLPHDWSFERRQSAIIHTVGLDGIPWPCKIQVEDSVLSVQRNRNESGKTYIPYDFPNHGELLIATGTLPERVPPYQLLLELTRGTLNRLRNQLSIWEEGGLKITPSITGGITHATTLFSKAITSDNGEDCDAISRLSLETAMDIVFELADLFGTEVTKFRQENSELNAFWLANTFSDDPLIKERRAADGFELVRLSPSAISQQSQSPQSKRVILGPMLDASSNGLNSTLQQLPDYQTRRDRITQTTREHMLQLSSSVSLIHVAAGLNGMGHRLLSYPQQLELTVELLQAVDDADHEIPTLVSFDFPWAERLASAVGGSHPLQIADSLLRQGAQISFLGIEVNLGYWPGGSVMRDPFQWIDMLDVWTQLGMPLIVILRTPSWSTATSQPSAAAVDESAQKHVNTFDHQTDQQRIAYLKTILPMLVARPAVHGLIWAQSQDDDDPRYPHGGLQNTAGQMKTVYDLLKSLPR